MPQHTPAKRRKRKLAKARAVKLSGTPKSRLKAFEQSIKASFKSVEKKEKKKK